MKNTVNSFLEKKQRGERIAQLTCYDYSTARIMEEAGVHAILVGDSLGNTVLGYPDTLSVTMEDMIHHSRAVARACQNTMVIMDMPFLSYQTSVYDAVCNAGRLMKEARGQAVKLEGGAAVLPQIRAIVAAGIPVQAHLGMTPQSVNLFGGFKVQGRDEAAARRLLEDAYAVQEAGAFSVVLECVPPKLAALITRKLEIPTIGIGAGAGCDGQVLVYQDMLGMFRDFTPKFTKRFSDIGERMEKAFRAYIEEVQGGVFPGIEHSYSKSDCDEEVLRALAEDFARERRRA